MLRNLCLLAALWSTSAFAVPFTLHFNWTAVAGTAGNSADTFDFTFIDPSGQLTITDLSVTLGPGMFYDLASGAPGFVTWGPYALNDGGAGATQTSADLGEGPLGNRTISWSFTNFTDGITFGYAADIDEDRTCPIPGLVCRINADSIIPASFIIRGAVEFTFTVAFKDGYTSQTFSSLDSCLCWDRVPLESTSTSIDGVLDTPEPATLLLGAGGLALCALRRKWLP